MVYYPESGPGGDQGLREEIGKAGCNKQTMLSTGWGYDLNLLDLTVISAKVH